MSPNPGSLTFEIKTNARAFTIYFGSAQQDVFTQASPQSIAVDGKNEGKMHSGAANFIASPQSIVVDELRHTAASDTDSDTIEYVGRGNVANEKAQTISSTESAENSFNSGSSDSQNGYIFSYDRETMLQVKNRVGITSTGKGTSEAVDGKNEGEMHSGAANFIASPQSIAVDGKKEVKMHSGAANFIASPQNIAVDGKNEGKKRSGAANREWQRLPSTFLQSIGSGSMLHSKGTQGMPNLHAQQGSRNPNRIPISGIRRSLFNAN